MRKRTVRQLLLAILFLLLLPGIGGKLDAQAASGWKFKSQLKGREKELYELLEKNYSAFQNYKKVNGVTLKLKTPMTQEEAESLEWFRVQQAFLMDHSDLFWISSLSLNVITVQDRVSGIYNTSSVVAYSVDRYAGIRSEIKSAQKGISKAIAEVKKRSGRYAKVKAAHDYVIKLTTYPKKLTPAYYHAVTGPLLKKYESQGVCEAYAWLFDIVCKANGIPCVILMGDGHAWNYVQMEDGNWYLVDATWDDDESKNIRYDYFLVGADTSVYGEKVKQTHRAASIKELYELNNSAPLKYPTLAKTAYKKGIQAQKATKVTSVKIKSTVTQVKAGKKLTLKATVLPNKASNKKLKWSSSNTKYATVSSKGVVKTKKAGKGKTVKITAKATDGSGKKATIKIKIK